MALTIPLTLGALVLFFPPAQAVDNADVEGANGTLYVSGALTESACRLEMSSVRQDVLLGEVGTGRLWTPGARGMPVRVDLRLEDCLHSSVASRDMRTGALTRAREQPVVSVSFSAVRDADNPALVKAQGVSGMGLRMEDAMGRDVRLGSRGAPLLLMPGQNTLSYTVMPERTRADLVAGSYQARVNVHLSYD
nr:fimbrial protein [Pantoea sp. 201603H]